MRLALGRALDGDAGLVAGLDAARAVGFAAALGRALDAPADLAAVLDAAPRAGELGPWSAAEWSDAFGGAAAVTRPPCDAARSGSGALLPRGSCAESKPEATSSCSWGGCAAAGLGFTCEVVCPPNGSTAAPEPWVLGSHAGARAASPASPDLTQNAKLAEIRVFARRSSLTACTCPPSAAGDRVQATTAQANRRIAQPAGRGDPSLACLLGHRTADKADRRGLLSKPNNRASGAATGSPPPAAGDHHRIRQRRARNRHIAVTKTDNTSFAYVHTSERETQHTYTLPFT